MTSIVLVRHPHTFVIYRLLLLFTQKGGSCCCSSSIALLYIIITSFQARGCASRNWTPCGSIVLVCDARACTSWSRRHCLVPALLGDLRRSMPMHHGH